ncbi:MAG: four-carbon acid sugar kinase family protein [Burkholderiaceae bacterium]
MLRLAWYGDDFTGASDTLATLSAAGLDALLFTSVPTSGRLAQVGPLDALGIAGTARALAPEAMRDELAPVADCFASLEVPVTHYKCCSTFDSAPHVGNLATGLDALRRPTHQSWVPIVGGQPSLGRYCIFGELYASATLGGQVHRIDRHPTMSRHPVTPMHEADLRLHLARQGLSRVSSLDVRLLDGASDSALDDALDGHLRTGPHAVLLDALREDHLARIGRLLWQRACRQPLLALGASSVAQALLAHWRQDDGLSGDLRPQVAPAAGPVFLLVGSQSPVTARQMMEGSEGYETLTLPVEDLVSGDSGLQAWIRRCVAVLAEGRSLLARTAPAGTDGSPPRAVAEACGRLLSAVLEQAPHVRRAGVAGGDTSSFALRALSPWALRWAGTLAPGVPLLRLHSDNTAMDGLELMLKGGQMGPSDVFQRLRLGTPGA